MATNRPNLGLQIALIIFVLLTITCAVGWVVYFNKTEDAVAAEKAAKEATATAEKAKAAADEEVAKIMEVFGRGKQEKATPVLEEWGRDKTLFAATVPEAAQTYPLMLKGLVDAYVTAQSQLADKDKTIADLNTKVAAQPKQIVAVTTEWEKKFQGESEKVGSLSTQFDADRKAFEEANVVRQKELEEKNSKVKAELDQKDKVIKERDDVIVGLQDSNKKIIEDIKPYKVLDYKSPDGIIVRVSQIEKTVWINRGRADGIRPQMTFSVYDRSAGNIAGENVKRKGTIEVIRLMEDGHTAEATITEDSIKDPFMRDDKIMNPAWVPGKMEHFAIAGFIDIDNDGHSDLSRLQTLIINNGGMVDAIIDDQGKRTGSITPVTKLLVLGQSPTEKDSDAVRKAWTIMMKDAAENQVNKMPLSEFIRYLGYQGSERSIPLGKGASDVPSDAPFKKRPAPPKKDGAFDR